jgi:SOS-response transcriptional repressor LexA
MGLNVTHRGEMLEGLRKAIENANLTSEERASLFGQPQPLTAAPAETRQSWGYPRAKGSGPLTELQRRAHEFICRYIEQHDYSPIYIEIAEELGLDDAGDVQGFLDALEDRGLITRQKGVPRSIRLVLDHSTELTKRQKAAYFFIRKYIRDNGQSPTVGEVAQALSLEVTRTAAAILDHLEDHGLITRRKRQSRSIKLTGKKFIE